MIVWKGRPACGPMTWRQGDGVAVAHVGPIRETSGGRCSGGVPSKGDEGEEGEEECDAPQGRVIGGAG